MTTAPANLIALRSYLAARTGLSSISLGIVGDTRHVRGYHLGRDRIYSATGLGDRDYSVQTTRDRDGLTNYASAMDIGMFAGLRDMSIFLVERARSGAADMRDIREIIYSPDGETVLRYDRQRGVTSAPRTGEADDSHRTHTHVSWYRDSRARDQIAPFAAYFEGESEIVKSFPVYEQRAYITALAGAKLFATSDRTGLAVHTLPTARELVYVGTFSDDVRIVAFEPDGPSDPNVSSLAYFVAKPHLRRDAAGKVIVRFVDEMTDAARRTIHNEAVDAVIGAANALRK